MLPDVFNAWCLQVYTQLEPYIDKSLSITFADPLDDPQTPEWNGPPLLVIFEVGDMACGFHLEVDRQWARYYASQVNKAFYRAQLADEL